MAPAVTPHRGGERGTASPPARARRPRRPAVRTASLLLALAATAGTALAPQPAAGGTHPGPNGPTGPTVVSLTFDDGSEDHYLHVLPSLREHGMTGTFYVNSGRVGAPGYLTAAQLRALAAEGHEIGGHTADHARLTELDEAERGHQICDDRAALLDLGLPVRNFAHPFGADSPEVRRQVARCGYNSARDIGGIVSPGSCSGCRHAEPVPPPDRYGVRTPDSADERTTLATLQEYVLQAERNGGGWVPIVFHHVCDACSESLVITPETFDAFLDWLRPRAAAGTTVATVDGVIGGPLRPVPATASASGAELAGARRTD
ncbi:polysaccharide deacetylase family protein [Allostreptomyces psammosilenae]|uniref:Peptidoglycan/xylan/chitin deacetylase (PgdA/CDA1 family) n=1 Tax=Allostreptomyces psammosilenae TaxID=1892865 RepID=A0A852ZSE7_9ACTN|nr:polysaccharide deacetylase family protein [Allostreptomyces psammosilenae]NYI04745.1 peptidoglycan/xylan/chitin deacetylase (PgdA/CDA1 family) [Allostreptomyces psammosilenae]